MKGEVVVLMFPLAVVAVFVQFLPLFTRRGVFFSATVAPEFPHSEDGRRLLRSYRWQAALWTGLAIVLAVLLGPRPEVGVLAPLLLLLGGSMLTYWRNFRTIHSRYGVRSPEVRQATLSVSPATETFNWLIILLPFAALAAVAVYLNLHWNHLPARFPVHWGMNGEPNRWVNRDWRGVYGPLLFGAYENVVLLALGWIMSHESRKTMMRYVTIRSLQLLLYPLTFTFMVIALRPLIAVPLWLPQVVLLACVVGIIYWSYRKISAPSAKDEVPEPQSDDYWKAGVFYWNPDDPAIFVSKRVGIGYTMNMANKWSWFALATVVVAFLVPSFLLK